MRIARKFFNKHLLNKTFQKNIHLNGKHGFYVPEDPIEHVQEVKDFLNRLKPDVMCLTFWNSWNPICKNNLNNYFNFTKTNGGIVHFLIDTDKFPKLRWYFDAKMEPSTKMYYYGAEIRYLKGCNYDRITKEVKYSLDYIRNGYKSYNGVEEWEQPYFKWEMDLSKYSNSMPQDASQSSNITGFRPLNILQGMPNEPRGIHWGIKK